MKEQLAHILDQSVCLSRKQMKEYLNGTMLPEEAHAAEVHLNSCALCSLAMEGFEEHSEAALQAIAALNSGFLKEHFDNITPQIHLNSMTHAVMPDANTRRRITLAPMWRVASVAAAALLILGIVWAYTNRTRSENMHHDLAMNTGSAANGGGGNGSAESGGGVAQAADAGSSTAAQSAANGVRSSGDAVGNGRSLASEAASNANNSTARHAEDLAGKTAANGSRPKAVTTSKPTLSNPDAQNQTANNANYASGVTNRTYVQYTDPDLENGEADGKKEKTASTVPVVTASDNGNTGKTVKAETDEREQIAKADEYYGKGSWSAALDRYTAGMKSADERTRYHSMIMAAECYAALGKRAKAEELLNKVIANASGKSRREAKRALKRLQ